MRLLQYLSVCDGPVIEELVEMVSHVLNGHPLSGKRHGLEHVVLWPQEDVDHTVSDVRQRHDVQRNILHRDG